MSPQDVAGTEESPVYAILKMKSDIGQVCRWPKVMSSKQFYTSQPWLEDRYSMKWDGEMAQYLTKSSVIWALLLPSYHHLIYILVVAWF